MSPELSGHLAEGSAPSDLLVDLNDNQRLAVLHDGGPLVIVAGAGSGKTRVLTRRIARLVESGVPPWRILAITFTNKSADEMRRRVVELVGAPANEMWVSTFHSACLRILRRNAERIGYRSSFSIYDDGDSRRLVEHVLDDLGVDQKRFPPRAVAGVIGAAKSDLVDAEQYSARAGTIYEQRVAQAYLEYERRLVAANAMDFDDLIVRTVRMLGDHDDIAEHYQERFVHLLVDEYQDTNLAQNELVILLGARHRNVCVVGDTDQSIYRFRGAEMRNLLEFERAFPDAVTIVLDQNYRSTTTILDAANAVIANNLLRGDKSLWSALGAGDKIKLYRGEDDRDEASFVASEIASLRREGVGEAEIAVFYRTNAQSRSLEQALADLGVNYKVVGGTRFFDRREIRDVLAYLRVVANPGDEVSWRRIANVPRRGVGDTTIARLVAFGSEQAVGFTGALRRAAEAGVTAKALSGIESLLALVDELASSGLVDAPPDGLVREILDRSGYREALEASERLGGQKAFEAEGRLENLDGLVDEASRYEDLASFLEQTALVAATDDLDGGPTVSLMSLHSAKGLEFDVVFLTGMEEDLFPHSQSIAEPDDLEEERRLCYVGLTRARRRLYLTHAWSRMLHGQVRDTIASRFLREIPEDLLDQVGPGRVIGAGHSGSRPDSWRPGGASGFSVPAGPAATTGAELLGLVRGDQVSHARFGRGVVTECEGEGDEARATVRFAGSVEKRFLLALTPLERL